MLNFISDIAKTVLIALIIVVPIRMFVFQPFLVQGDSMLPSFESGDYLIVDQVSYRFTEPTRGDVVVFEFPFDRSQRFIKRIIGLPGETVEIKDGKVVVYDESHENSVVLEEPYIDSTQTPGSTDLVLEEGDYFVLGDNREFSSDSRRWGVVPESHIIGKAQLRIFPVSAFAKVDVPDYN